MGGEADQLINSMIMKTTLKPVIGWKKMILAVEVAKVTLMSYFAENT
jgi:hypothetical protein